MTNKMVNKTPNYRRNHTPSILNKTPLIIGLPSQFLNNKIVYFCYLIAGTGLLLSLFSS